MSDVHGIFTYLAQTPSDQRGFCMPRPMARTEEAQYDTDMEFIDDLGGVEPIPPNAREVFRGNQVSVWHWEQTLYDGTTTTFEAMRRPNSVHTIGILPDGHILLIEDEQPNRGRVLTPPGGVVDTDESPEEAARREFLEETGYEIGELVPWHYYRASTRMEWYIYAFIGRNIRKVRQPQLEAGERVRIRFFSFEEFLQLGFTPQLRDRILRTVLLAVVADPERKARLKEQLLGLA